MNLSAVLRFAGGLATAAAGSALFDAAGVPLAYILGAMAGGALFANLVGLRGGTRYVRRSGQLLIGAATGALLSADVLTRMLELLPQMIGAALLANLIGVLLAFPLARLAGVDLRTALLSSIPAGMSEMASLAAEVGARVDVVTIVHTLRVVIIVTAVPFLFSFDPGAPSPDPVPGATYVALAATVVVGAVLANLGTRIGMLNPWVTMPMAAGAVIVALGFPLAIMPQPIIVVAQVLIGFSLGARLRLSEFARVPRVAAAGLLTGLLLVGAMVFLAVPLFVALAGVPAPTMALALAPGGIGEMIASAKALGAASALVAGFQFTRSFLTNLLAPSLILRWSKPGTPARPERNS